MTTITCTHRTDGKSCNGCVNNAVAAARAKSTKKQVAPSRNKIIKSRKVSK